MVMAISSAAILESCLMLRVPRAAIRSLTPTSSTDGVAFRYERMPAGVIGPDNAGTTAGEVIPTCYERTVPIRPPVAPSAEILDVGPGNSRLACSP